MSTKETLEFVQPMSFLILSGLGSPNVFVPGQHKQLHNKRCPFNIILYHCPLKIFYDLY